jgi:hypothetical protein
MRGNEIPEHTIQFAVEFWVNALKEHHGLAAPAAVAEKQEKLEDRIPAVPGLLGSIRALQSKRITPEKIEAFGAELGRLLREAKPSGEYGGINGLAGADLITDYNAFGLLLAAGKHAGISDMAFPWKTKIYLRGDVVKDSAGNILFNSAEASSAV